MRAYLKKLHILSGEGSRSSFKVKRHIGGHCVSQTHLVPGWHRRINGRAGRPDLGFYVLVPLLCREAETVDLTIRLVSEHALTWVHRKIFKEVHGRLFKIWEKYEDDDMTTTQLLRACNHIIGLGPSTTQDDIHNEDF
ncbi:hypothetical protein DPMN_117761 [Dreissena polymorpha]|uniref:Uncharacterized protein n=1 Tax=Dreissena polymorpha TaxID=45954 RepID=A0A9D4GGB8_DREPO|nr:hypothetical protein DPMN_117761 [Dreissena polymorpha]